MPATAISRFFVHDDLTAPEGSLPVLKGALSSAGQLPNFLGVLGNSPAALRAYARYRAELRHGTLSTQTSERIALAVAEHHHSAPGIDLHTRAARNAGIGFDEIGRARQFDSADEQHAALLAWLKPAIEASGKVPEVLHEDAREIGWSDEQLIEALAVAALEGFAAMVNVAGEVPVDGSTEESRLRAA
jgi:AhpD family alkylhydroperoxidase